jgi:class 3 adenylate cyclase
MKKLYAIAILFLYATTCLGQNARIDSLREVNVYYTREDDTKLNILNSLAQEYEWWQIDSGVACANQAIALAQKLNNQKQLAAAYYNKVRLLYYQGKYAEREQILKTALEISTKLNDKNGIGEYYYNYAFVKVNQERKQFIQKAFDIFTQVNDSEGIARTSLFLGGNTNDTVIAMQFLNKALKIFSQQKNLPQIAHTLQSMRGKTTDIKKKEELQQRALTISHDKITLTAYHYGLAIRYHSQSTPDYPKSLEQWLIAAKISEQHGNITALTGALANVGEIFRYLNRSDDALKYLEKASMIAEKTGHISQQMFMCRTKGLIYTKIARYPEAIKELNKYLKLNEIQKSDNDEFLAYYYLASTYQKAKDYEKSLYCLKKAEELNKKTPEVDQRENLGGMLIIKGLVIKNAPNSLLLKEGIQPAQRNIVVINTIKEGLIYFPTDQDGMLALYEMYRLQHDDKNALKYHLLYVAAKDSIASLDNSKAMTNLQIDFEVGKKETQISLLNKDKEIQDKELDKQKVVRNAFIGGFGIMLLFAGLFLFQRNRIKKGKKLSDNLLLNILPAEVAEELKEKGTADAKYFDNVTVLFTDFKSFTTVSEQLSPQELVNELHACFKAFDEICGKYNIEKIKTIGDAYLAVCGLPLTDEKHAENVVNAALEIREFMEKRRKNLGEKTFEIRIGINSGSVVAGIVGVKKFAYDIWGDTVNTAARMEQNSEAGKINISETTYELVKDSFTCEYRGEIDAKNKGKLKMYFVEKL